MTQVLTDEQKIFIYKAGRSLTHALRMVEKLPESRKRVDATDLIREAAHAVDQIAREFATQFRATQTVDGRWSIESGFDKSGQPQTGWGGLTATAALDAITRMVMGACPEVDEPVADMQQATDADSVTGPEPEGPDNAEWRRVRALELAISANQGMHIDAVMGAAKEIEAFLKRGA